MDEMECEKCPVAYHCAAWQKKREDNKLSYHPQNVVRVSYYNCPLLLVVQPEKSEEEET